MRLKEFLKEMEDPEERTEPYLDRQTDYDAPPRDDGDDSYDFEDEESNLIGKLIADLSIATHEGGKKLTDVVKDLESQYYRDAAGKEEQLRSMQ